MPEITALVSPPTKSPSKVAATLTVAAAFMASFGAPHAVADTCTVPGSHETINSAIDDPVCTEVELDALIYDETLDVARSIDLIGPPADSAEIRGPVRVAGNATSVHLERLIVTTDCDSQAILARGGAQVSASDLDVVFADGSGCLGGLFLDGFEVGTTAAWSAEVTP